MTGRKATDKDEGNFDSNKLIERHTWQTKGEKKSTVDRTTSSIKNVNNKGDECSGRDMNWQKS
jgi:hypothetical protein